MRSNGSIVAVLGFLGINLVLGGCSSSEAPEAEKGKDRAAVQVPASGSAPVAAGTANCAIFTQVDAATILGVPAAEIQLDSQELYPGNWQCGYRGTAPEARVSFNISLAETVEDAITDMEQYRGNLEIAKGVGPFKENTAQGAFSNISGIGDDALWTSVNGTLTVRKGNISLQVQLPKEKDRQVRVSEMFLARLSE